MYLFMGLFKRHLLITPINNTYLINIYGCLFKRPLFIIFKRIYLWGFIYGCLTFHLIIFLRALTS